MSRNKTLFLYNDTQQDQQWTVYSEGVINQNITIGQQRRTFTLTLSDDATLQVGVDDTVYLTATYTYATDSWTSHTDTPNEIQCTTVTNAINISSSFTPGSSDSGGD
jgi:hypothetical protein